MEKRQSSSVMVDVKEKGDGETIRPFEPRYLHFRTLRTFLLEFQIEAGKSNLIGITIRILIQGRATAIGRNHKHTWPYSMSHQAWNWICSAAENSRQCWRPTSIPET